MSLVTVTVRLEGFRCMCLRNHTSVKFGLVVQMSMFRCNWNYVTMQHSFVDFEKQIQYNKNFLAALTVLIICMQCCHYGEAFPLVNAACALPFWFTQNNFLEHHGTTRQQTMMVKGIITFEGAFESSFLLLTKMLRKV